MRALCLALILLFVTTTIAVASSPGTTGFELFRTDGFARSSALGGSQIAVGGDLHNLFTNPAGLADISRPMASAGFFKHVMDMNSGNLSYARPVREAWVVGLGLTYFDYGSFDRASEYGEKQGEFGASDVLITASLARSERSENLSIGISLKYLNCTIDGYSASAVAADLAFIRHTGFHDWSVGVGVFNLGEATSAFLKEKDPLPTAFRFGLSVPLEHLPVRFSFSWEYTMVYNRVHMAYVAADDIRGAGGLEVDFSKYVQGRLGYNTVGLDQRVGLDRDALAGFSAGLGIHASTLTFDYALTSQGEVGFLHRFSLGTSFPPGQQARD